MSAVQELPASDASHLISSTAGIETEITQAAGTELTAVVLLTPSATLGTFVLRWWAITI